MAFQTIFTVAGESGIAAAIASAQPLNIVAMAVGDGGGNDVTPDGSQTQLVREVYRGSVNQVYQDPDHAGQFVVEMLVPKALNGFTMREVGVFDSNGRLIAVANTPATYKPTADDGAFTDVVIRLYIKVENAAAVSVIVDPNIATATHSWVINNITMATLAPGGTHYQVLRKASNSDGDVEWADADVANVIVDVIEEVQTLADAQTVVDLALTTTRGLAVYINGERLRSNEWTAHPTINTRLTLAAARAAGAKLIAVQNEPSGHAPFPLVQGLNLADVPNKAEARSNLDVYSRDEMLSLMAPPGQIIFHASPFVPPGYLKANGALVSRASYSRLFWAIGTTFGAGDGVTTFQLPDMRGMFPRGLDEGRGVDPGRELGSYQDDGIKAHQHEFPGDDHLELFGYQRSGNPGFGYDANSKLSGDGKRYRTKADPLYPMISETRPKNMALSVLIKY